MCRSSPEPDFCGITKIRWTALAVIESMGDNSDYIRITLCLLECANVTGWGVHLERSYLFSDVSVQAFLGLGFNHNSEP